MSVLKLGFKKLEQITMVIFSQSQQALQSKQRLEGESNVYREIGELLLT